MHRVPKVRVRVKVNDLTAVSVAKGIFVTHYSHQGKEHYVLLETLHFLISLLIRSSLKFF